jgi:hypothetical protein
MHSHSREADHLAVVYLENDLYYINCSGGGPIEKGLSSEALVVEHFIPLPKQHPLAYKGVWELPG